MAAPFVSFAQNFEDVMLWRALKHVGHGFYIDVGAYSPLEHSVTQAFYERGWRGINIEPHSDYHRQFLVARPADINLNVAAGDQTTDQAIYIVHDTGLSTLDETQAQERVREGRSVVREQVHVDTLASIWMAHVARDQPVHFLKVDVEGFEREVLLGNDWDACRPWIIVVEATKPMTMEPSHQAWEGILIGAGYFFAYGDGLNRFYVANEHADLATAFEYPPNVFDEFVRASEGEARERATRAEARAAGAEAELIAIMAGRSWRITGPLRAAAGLARRTRAMARRRLTRHRAVVITRSIGIPLTLHRIIEENPAVRRRAAILKRVPGVLMVSRRLDRVLVQRGSSLYEVSDLSPRAQRIYKDLRSPRDLGPTD